ncbi:hypothetical protein RchiOBHm_Chr4g0404941 [Rosa chinensis]|uniref:Uncharacterized protein n=1 Tax=Rosa chinensis TaxID=74649 RepID=A0A2P6QTY7_ROSCH|nr:hypothetical protein RchiOBHm_Chr4g0404941 [Rosa chinensis]
MVVFVYGDPRGVLLQHTICRDSPAPFNCLYCGDTRLTDGLILGLKIFDVIDGWDLIFDAICGLKKIISKPSLASVVAEFEKSDPCIVMDPPNWTEASFAGPAR